MSSPRSRPSETTTPTSDPRDLLGHSRAWTRAFGEPDASAVDLSPGDAWPERITKYVWDGIVLTLLGENEYYPTGSARLIITSAEINDVAVRTEDAITIGSTRDQAISAGAWDPLGDGLYLALGEAEVPGTTSLPHPGEVGIQYVVLAFDGDTVTQMSAVLDDYSTGI